MTDYLETIHVVYLPNEKIHGTVSDIGLYASVVKYAIGEVEYEELFDNEDFIILDEINIMHFERKENINEEEND